MALRRAESRKFPQELFFTVTGWLLVTIPFGARLLHVLYEEQAYYSEFPLRILEVWRGGFTYFGGLIFSLLFFVIYFRKPRAKSFGETVDFFAPVLALGTGLGRIACFLQGCCFGKELDLFWSVRGLHPTQLYIFVWEMILFFYLLKFEKKNWKSGNLFLFWLTLSALGRLFIEFYRADFRGQMISGLSISQVISVGIIILTFTTFLVRKK